MPPNMRLRPFTAQVTQGGRSVVSRCNFSSSSTVSSTSESKVVQWIKGLQWRKFSVNLAMIPGLVFWTGWEIYKYKKEEQKWQGPIDELKLRIKRLEHKV